MIMIRDLNFSLEDFIRVVTVGKSPELYLICISMFQIGAKATRVYETDDVIVAIDSTMIITQDWLSSTNNFDPIS